MPGRRLQRREECPSRRLWRPLCRHHSIPDDRQADPESGLRMLGRRPPGKRTRGRRLREPTQNRWTVKWDLCLSQRFHGRRGVHGSKTGSGTLGPSKAEGTGREDQASRETEGPRDPACVSYCRVEDSRLRDRERQRTQTHLDAQTRVSSILLRRFYVESREKKKGEGGDSL